MNKYKTYIGPPKYNSGIKIMIMRGIPNDENGKLRCQVCSLNNNQKLYCWKDFLETQDEYDIIIGFEI